MKIKKQKELFLSCNVAGFAHYEGCIVFNELQIGTKLQLVREDENAYDHDAVAIFYGDTHIGYVPSSKNEQLATMLDLGHEKIGCVTGPIVLKMPESVVNRKEAPTVEASTLTPPAKVKQAGKMMKPDASAIKVSSPVMVTASPSRERSLEM